MIPRAWMFRRGESTETESRSVVAQGWGVEEGGSEAKGDKISFWDEENILKSLMAMDAHLCEYTKSIKLYFF